MMQTKEMFGKYKIVILVGCAVIICAVGLLLFTGWNSAYGFAPETNDLKDMAIGAELPYLLYANADYCIVNMWHGGVIVYDFKQRQITDRVSYEQLAQVGFQYPVPLLSSDGNIIYFAENAMTEKPKITHAYDLKKHKLGQTGDESNYFIHHKDFYANEIAEKLLSDGFAYGSTFIELEDKIVVSRYQNSTLLSDLEVVFVDKNAEQSEAFHLLSGDSIGQ